MQRLMLALAGMLLVVSARAITVEGVTLPDEVRVGGQLLVLNGAGIREKFFFDIYLAALYLPGRESDARQILQSDRPWRMIMHFVYSEVKSGKLADGWQDGFEANLEAGELQALQARLDHFKSLFPDMRRGEEVVLDYFPGKGVQVLIKGEAKGTIGGSDFARALLSVWLGEKPVTGDLKRALLGAN